MLNLYKMSLKSVCVYIYIYTYIYIYSLSNNTTLTTSITFLNDLKIAYEYIIECIDYE